MEKSSKLYPNRPVLKNIFDPQNRLNLLNLLGFCKIGVSNLVTFFKKDATFGYPPADNSNERETIWN